MSNYTNRLNRREGAIGPGAERYRFSSMVDYDEQGQCAEVVVYDIGRSTVLGQFTAKPGESTEALCSRAYGAVGCRPDTDGVIEHHIVHAGQNGGPAPGFERFAK